MNKKLDIGLLVLLAVGLFFIRGTVNIGINKEPVEDKMAELINNSVSAEYYYNIKADEINKAYGNFARHGWDSFCMLKDLPGSEKSDNINVLEDYYYVDYGTFAKHRTRFFQNRTGAQITEDVFCMNLCQKNEISKFRDALYISDYGKDFTAKLLDFYNKDTGEFVKTVTFLWWQQDSSSFFVESDYSLEELGPYIEDMAIINVEQHQSAKTDNATVSYPPLPPV